MNTLKAILFLVCAVSLIAQPLPQSAPSAAPVPHTETVTLAWDASTSTNVTGYRIYYWQPGGVTNYSNVGNTTKAIITGLTWPTSFYATALSEDDESLPSNLLLNLHWETDVTVRAQSAPAINGTFTNAFVVLKKTNVSGMEFYRLLAETTRALRTTP